MAAYLAIPDASRITGASPKLTVALLRELGTAASALGRAGNRMKWRLRRNLLWATFIAVRDREKGIAWESRG